MLGFRRLFFSFLVQRGIDDDAYHSIGDEDADVRPGRRAATAVSNIVPSHFRKYRRNIVPFHATRILI